MIQCELVNAPSTLRPVSECACALSKNHSPHHCHFSRNQRVLSSYASKNIRKLPILTDFQPRNLLSDRSSSTTRNGNNEPGSSNRYGCFKPSEATRNGSFRASTEFWAARITAGLIIFVYPKSL